MKVALGLILLVVVLFNEEALGIPVAIPHRDRSDGKPLPGARRHHLVAEPEAAKEKRWIRVRSIEKDDVQEKPLPLRSHQQEVAHQIAKRYVKTGRSLQKEAEEEKPLPGSARHKRRPNKRNLQKEAEEEKPLPGSARHKRRPDKRNLHKDAGQEKPAPGSHHHV